MQFTTSIAALSALALSSVVSAQNAFSVITPSSLVQCQPFLISWTGGQAPYFPRITQPGQTSNIIENLSQTSENSISWTVNIAVGQSVTIVITDSTGATAASAQSPRVASGSTSSCLSSSATGSTTGSSSPSSSADTSSPSTSTAAVTSSAVASSSAARSSAGSATSSASSAGTSSTSGSSTDGAINLRGFSAVLAGAAGVVVAAMV